MRSLLRRLFGKVVSIREGEAATAWLMFAYSFLAMTSYNILKPVTRSKFITALGADNLPYVQLVAGAIIGVLMQLYGRAIARLPRRWIIPVTQAGVVVLLLVFWVLFQSDADWVSAAFYVLGLILGLLLISQFWTLANDIYDARQAKRLFGFVGGGASLGGAMGAAITSFAVEEVGTNNLLLVSAAVMTACVGLVMAIGRREYIKNGPDAFGEEPSVGGGEAIRMLRSSKHLQIIALVIGLAAIGSAILEQQLNMAASAVQGEGNTDAITGFLAQVTFYTSLIGFVVQVGLTSQIHRSLGLAFALLILPLILGSTATIILLNGALWAPAVGRVLDTSMRYTVDKTTREVLFLPLPVEMKYAAKPFVDVTVDRFAKSLGAVLLLILIKPWGLNLDWRRLSYASLVVTALWIIVAMRARVEYLKRFRRSIESRTIAPAALRLDVADAATIETLVEELSNPDESCVLYAIDMLEALEKRHLVTPLLLHHESANVRARALRALESARASTRARWAAVVERMLNDQDADVRAAAVHALAVLSTEDAYTVMRRYLDDPEPRVAATAAAVLANSRVEADVDAAEAALIRLTEDTREIAAGARREAAAALARITNPRLRPLLVPLIRDGNLDVARQAIRSVQAMGSFDPLFVPALVALLGHRVLKPAARDVLVGLGAAVLEPLAYFLNDPDENIWVRRHIPATLALFPTQRSMDILLDSLNASDGFLRYKVVTAIEKLRRNHPNLTVPRGTIETLVLKECSRYNDHKALRSDVVQRDGHASSLLVRALDDKLERSLDRIYRLLSLIYPWKDIDAARRAIESGERRTRNDAFEYLDNVLKGLIRAPVMAVLEGVPIDEQARRANVDLRGRSRNLEDTLALLVRDEDQVLAASAIHLVQQRQSWSLSDDLEFERTHRSPDDRYVVEAATWALAMRQSPDNANRDQWRAPFPVVDLADRIRRISLFDFVSVDELFRIAATGRQLSHEAGRELYHEGLPPEDVHFLLDGSVHVSGLDGTPYELPAPAALAFEEILQGSPLPVTISVGDHAVCLALGRAEFLTMLSDNIALAQGLFRMLLDTPTARQWRTVHTPLEEEPTLPRNLPLSPLDKVLLLRRNPLLARATVSQLRELAGITREVPLAAGSVLFAANDKPVLYHVVEGEVRLDAEGSDAIVAGPGCTIGVAEILAGVPVGRRATVSRAGQALRVDHEELYEVLADHIDLLQSLFSGLLTARPPKPRKTAGPLEAARVAG